MTIAIFGGSFNPITNAHLDIIKPIFLKKGTRPKIVVSTENPFKDNLISYAHRLNMVELAIQQFMEEIEESAYFYGLYDARHLKKKYAGPLRSWHILEDTLSWCETEPVELLFGQDMKKEIDSFEKIDYIRENASIRFLPETNSIHATEIRAMIQDGNDEWKTHIPSVVADYIELHNLYKEQ